jgi:hypothetical protein
MPIDNKTILAAIANGGTIALGTIPKDALIIENVVDVAVAFDDTGAMTGQLGDGTDADRFAAAAVSLKSAAVTRPGDVAGTSDADGVDSVYGVTTEVTLTVAAANGDGALGRATWYLHYLRPDAAHGVS